MKILGYDCTRYLLKDSGREVEVWATTELGPYVSASNPMQKKGPKNAWETMLAGAGLFPLRVAERDRGGRPDIQPGRDRGRPGATG